eukprot:6007870-Ditylum_brightwellii.AAC.1
MKRAKKIITASATQYGDGSSWKVFTNIKKGCTAMANALYKSSLILHNDDCMNSPGKSIMAKKKYALTWQQE